MLGSLTPSSPPRRRGAQPGNLNALQHGLYSILQPNPALQASAQLRLLRRSAYLNSVDSLERLVAETFELLIDHFLACDDAPQGQLTFIYLNRFFRTLSTSLRLKRMLKQARDQRDLLPGLAREALNLSTLEFTDPRLSIYALYAHLRHDPTPVFVPPHQQKPCAISDPGSPDSSSISPQSPAFASPLPFPEPVVPLAKTPAQTADDDHQPSSDHWPLNTDYWFALTSSQWASLSPLLASLRAQLAEMGLRPKKRPYPDRFLLECILTRLAFSLSWTDMHEWAPVRACQALYRQLCTSGLMNKIYHYLFHHLETCGDTNLPDLVQKRVFFHLDGRIYLCPDAESSWQNLTGLLFMQRALFNRRHLKRLLDLEKRGRPAPSQKSFAGAPAGSLAAIVMSLANLPPERRPHRPSRRARSARSDGLIPIADAKSTDPILYKKFMGTREDSENSPP
jgi:hypothetical protein